MDALGAFLELSKLESKKVRLQVLRLVDALVDTLVEQLGPLPRDWYRQGAMLLDCAEALNVHVAVYEYQLNQLRRHSGGRALRGIRLPRRRAAAVR